MRKGSLTLYISLSLAIGIGFILYLTRIAIQNGQALRVEGVFDICMNSALGEYSIALKDRYDLLYIDTSYLSFPASVNNLQKQLFEYMHMNLDQKTGIPNPPWGALQIDEVKIPTYETAADDQGASMRSQAICYAEDINNTVIQQEVEKAAKWVSDAYHSDIVFPMDEWNSIMEQLAGMELPKITNERGELEEVPLSNPADAAYALSGSDCFYLVNMNMSAISAVSIIPEDYISSRQIDITSDSNREYRQDEKLFAAYMLDKLGCYSQVRNDSCLNCQLEYLEAGEQCDQDNLRHVVNRIFQWRFVDNVRLAFSDGGLIAEACSAADELLVIQLDPRFRQPVIDSILYACAFLESISDTKVILNGGRVPFHKEAHTMSVSHILSGTTCTTSSNDGLLYRQYLLCMLLMMDQITINNRVMDIMEMDIRTITHNQEFKMDYCVERFLANAHVKGMGNQYCISRTYGYY